MPFSVIVPIGSRETLAPPQFLENVSEILPKIKFFKVLLQLCLRRSCPEFSVKVLHFDIIPYIYYKFLHCICRSSMFYLTLCLEIEEQIVEDKRKVSYLFFKFFSHLSLLNVFYASPRLVCNLIRV